MISPAVVVAAEHAAEGEQGACAAEPASKKQCAEQQAQGDRDAPKRKATSAKSAQSGSDGATLPEVATLFPPGSSALRSGVAVSDCRYEQEVETEEEEALEYDVALQSDEELEEADLEEDVPEHDDELEDLEVEQDEEEEPLAVEYVGGPRVNLKCSETLGPQMLNASGEAEYEKMADEDLWKHLSTQQKAGAMWMTEYAAIDPQCRGLPPTSGCRCRLLSAGSRGLYPSA